VCLFVPSTYEHSILMGVVQIISFPMKFLIYQDVDKQSQPLKGFPWSMTNLHLRFTQFRPTHNMQYRM
jgi:hypothetical protein